MSGTSGGTGYPYILRCAMCKCVPFEYKGYSLRATGRTRSLYGKQRWQGNTRALGFAAEYECQECGHTGWSRHISMLDKGAADDIDLLALARARGHVAAPRKESDDAEQ